MKTMYYLIHILFQSIKWHDEGKGSLGVTKSLLAIFTENWPERHSDEQVNHYNKPL